MVCNQIQVAYPGEEIDNSGIPYQLMAVNQCQEE